MLPLYTARSVGRTTRKQDKRKDNMKDQENKKRYEENEKEKTTKRKNQKKRKGEKKDKGECEQIKDGGCAYVSQHSVS